MDVTQFLAEFKHIVSAPGGVQRVRALILQLAVSGHLVQHDQNEERVEIALVEAEYRRIQFEKDFELRGIPLHPNLREDEYPYIIPAHWRWQRLEQIVCYIQRGKGPSYANSGSTFVVSQKCIRWKGFDLSVARRADESSLKIYGKERFLQPGDLLWNSTGTGTVGRAAIYNEKEDVRAVADSHVTVIRLSNFIPRYVWCVIAAPWVQARTSPEHKNSIVSGTTKQVELATSSVRAMAIPCPPIGEQKRIIAKVDELMALCDKLEAQQQEGDGLCKRACTIVFQTMGRAKTPAEIQNTWERVRINSHLLLDTPESVQSYKGAILDLAMSGLLLAQSDRAPSSGQGLLEQIAQKRAIWVETSECQELQEATSMLKKTRTQRAVEPDIDLPKHWAWASLLQISQAVVDCHNKTAPYVSDGVHLIRTTDIRNRRIDLKHTRKISPETYAYWARRLPPKAGDIIFTREAPMGEAAIIPEGEKVCLGQRTMLIRLFPDLFNNGFLLYAIYSPSFQDRMVKAAIGMTVKHLRVGGVEDLMLPVPPKEEQDRIVAIVGALLAHCDELETQLARKRDTAAGIAKASVEAITGIRIEEKEKMKTPKTELVSTLRVGVSPTNGNQAPLTAILIRNNGELPAKTLWNTSGLEEIDAFYQQLKTEMANGWIVQPEVAYMKEAEVG